MAWNSRKDPELCKVFCSLLSLHFLSPLFILNLLPFQGLTWTLFEQVKLVRSKLYQRPATDIENSVMGCIASATTVCIMIPMDTVKTRLVTQMNYPDLAAYAGINDCFRTVLKEEGIGAFYRGLTPRLLSVVPMIGILFGVYEVSDHLDFSFSAR